MAVGHNDDIRLYVVLLHTQPAIVEFYDRLLYEVSPSTLRAASVVGEPERQRGGPALPATNLNPRIKHYPLRYFGNTLINFFVEPGESICHCVIDCFAPCCSSLTWMRTPHFLVVGRMMTGEQRCKMDWLIVFHARPGSTVEWFR